MDVETVTVRFFGRMADVAGRERAVDLVSSDATLGDLIERLATSDPALASLLRRPGNFFAVDDCVVDLEARIAGAKEIAVGSPVSGG